MSSDIEVRQRQKELIEKLEEEAKAIARTGSAGTHQEKRNLEMRDTREQLRFLDMVFVIDSTGSMSAYIEEVKKKVIEIIEEIERGHIGPKVNLGLVAYGDHPPEDTIVTKSFNLTENRERILENVRMLPRTAGGDYPEAVVDGLHVGLEMKWRRGSCKALILIGDAPPHGYAEMGAEDRFPNGCPCGLDPMREAKRARELGITIYTVGVSPRDDTERCFKKIASTTAGVYLTLDESSRLSKIIVDLVQRELAKMETDMMVYETLNRAKIHDPEFVSTALNISRSEVQETIVRLEKRGMLTDQSHPNPTAHSKKRDMDSH